MKELNTSKAAVSITARPSIHALLHVVGKPLFRGPEFSGALGR